MSGCSCGYAACVSLCQGVPTANVTTYGPSYVAMFKRNYFVMSLVSVNDHYFRRLLLKSIWSVTWVNGGRKATF